MMNKSVEKSSRAKTGLIELSFLGGVLLLSFTVLKSEYLFGWAAHNWKFYLILSAIAVALLLFNKKMISIGMTIGITVGLFFGNYVGGLVKSLNENQILEGMTAEEVYRLRHHPGFEIWMGIIILSIIIGVVVHKKAHKNRLD